MTAVRLLRSFDTEHFGVVCEAPDDLVFIWRSAGTSGAEPRRSPPVDRAGNSSSSDLLGALIVASALTIASRQETWELRKKGQQTKEALDKWLRQWSVTEPPYLAPKMTLIRKEPADRPTTASTCDNCGAIGDAIAGVCRDCFSLALEVRNQVRTQSDGFGTGSICAVSDGWADAGGLVAIGLFVRDHSSVFRVAVLLLRWHGYLPSLKVLRLGRVETMIRTLDISSKSASIVEFTGIGSANVEELRLTLYSREGVGR